MVRRSCFVQRPFCSSSSTIAAISHMLAMVASSRDMVSRVGRSSLMAYPCLRHRLRAAWNDRAGACKIPHPLPHTPRCHGSPHGFVEVGPHPIPGSHLAREPRHCQLSLALFCTVEFVLRLARQKRAVRYVLEGRVVGQGPYLHEIPVAANGVWINVDRIPTKAIGGANRHPFRTRRSSIHHQECDQGSETHNVGQRQREEWTRMISDRGLNRKAAEGTKGGHSSLAWRPILL